MAVRARMRVITLSTIIVVTMLNVTLRKRKFCNAFGATLLSVVYLGCVMSSLVAKVDSLLWRGNENIPLSTGLKAIFGGSRRVGEPEAGI